MHGTLENWDLEQKIIQEAEQRSDAYYEFLNLKISNTNKHMESVSTLNFEDQFDFSPEPLDSPLKDSDEKLNFGQGQQQHQQHQDQFTQLIHQQPVPVESVSNSSQGTSSQVSSPLAKIDQKPNQNLYFTLYRYFLKESISNLHK